MRQGGSATWAALADPADRFFFGGGGQTLAEGA